MVVLLHLGADVRRAEVVRCGDQDRLDLVVHGDGYTLEVFGARRGAEDGQWEPEAGGA